MGLKFGIRGGKGADGEQGEQGLQGEQGEQGIQGEPGIAEPFTGFDSKLSIGLSADQQVLEATWTLIEWAVAHYDGLSELDTENNRIVIAVDGYYSFKYCILITNVLDDECQVRFKINNVVEAGSAGMVGDVTFGFTKFTGGMDHYLEAGDLITMEIYQSKINYRVLPYTTEGGCRLSMHRFG